jgi:hypothetical protein
MLERSTQVLWMFLWIRHSDACQDSCKPPDTMERETGIEPATSSLGSWRSTAELLPLTRSEPNHNTGVASRI